MHKPSVGAAAARVDAAHVFRRVAGFPGFIWRLSVLSVCFAAFGIGGIILRFTLLPCLRLLPGTPEARQLRTRKLAHGCFSMLAVVLRRTGTMVFDVRHPERLHGRGRMILANHPSYLDVVMLLALVPEANCVVKRSLFRSWFFGGVVRRTGYVSNADPDSLVDDCAAVLARGDTLLVFPEGTRTEPGQPLRFQRGTARILLRSRCEFVPVILRCEPPVWAKGFRLTRIARQPFSIRVEVESALRAEDLGAIGDEEEAKAARRLTRRLEAYFTAKVESSARLDAGAL
jgi:1-acyl-sn-glycerol-3-phosphate acyltransferase